jgi:glycerophosphoryl diester phosphodiesterase
MVSQIISTILIFIIIWVIAIKPRSGHVKLEELRQFRYAHRGYHDKAADIPENSLAAFRRAAENGWGAELDVHLTADGRLAVIHDSSLKRVCGEGANVCVEDMTAAQLAAYRLEGTDEKIPFLEEVLPIFEKTAPLIIELKVERRNHKKLCAAVWELLKDYKGHYCIESFQPEAVKWFNDRQPDVVRGQLVCRLRKNGAKVGWLSDFIMQNLLLNFLTRPDFIAYKYTDRNNLSFRLCRYLFKVQEVSWTVTKPEVQQALEKERAMIIFEQYNPDEI